ncbi:SDR family oxidoreductase [Streptomyces sp. NPDC101150]|uniref:SDR family oxidoreductase n=1 Tax=Streptomyces sp. NPDC101150 TaxID=3366114 RepID=UPI00381D9D04
MRLTGLEGRVFVVTGAAGGIGQAVCRTLVTAGARVAAVDRAEDRLKQLEATGGTVGQRDDRAPEGTIAGAVTAYPADVAGARSADKVLARVEADLGAVEGLVNASGVLHTGPALSASRGDWEEVMAVNATGVFSWSQAAGARMTPRGRGVIVTVASVTAGTLRTGMAAYAASKAAAATYTLCLGLELAPKGIRCNVVSPGTTDTPMLERLGPGAVATAIRGDLANHHPGTPNGRVAQPQDIADAVVFLLSDQARHITLHSLYVDGGATLRG